MVAANMNQRQRAPTTQTRSMATQVLGSQASTGTQGMSCSNLACSHRNSNTIRLAWRNPLRRQALALGFCSKFLFLAYRLVVQVEPSVATLVTYQLLVFLL